MAPLKQRLGTDVMVSLAFLGNISIWELLIVLIIVLLLFGHRLPGLGRAMGRSVTEFKDGLGKGKGKGGKAANDAPGKNGDGD